MANEALVLLQLMQAKGIGPHALARLLERLEREGLSLDESSALTPEEIVARFGLTEDQACSFRDHEEAAAQLAERLEEHGVRTVRRGGPGYPGRLTAVLADKAPPVLFVAGSAGLLRQPAVGFCGARDASDEALRSAAQLAGVLAKEGLVIVSGHAPGADETAHRAALDAGGATAFVLPEGILHFRPRSSLAGCLEADRFVVVSEFPPKLPWSAANAMQRNRTICGLAQALIVVEAGTSGGTWEAGLEALRLRIPLFVFDLSDPAESARGNGLLISKGGEALPCIPGELPDWRSLRAVLDGAKPAAAERLLF